MKGSIDVIETGTDKTKKKLITGRTFEIGQGLLFCKSNHLYS